MLSISRWMAAAILVTVFSVSAMVIRNFLSESTDRIAVGIDPTPLMEVQF